MNILFRVDASRVIGTGHVMRCLTLASALKEAGCKCTFVTRLHEGNLVSLIKQKGFEVIELPVISYIHSDLAHSFWLGGTIEEDVEQTRHGIKNQLFDWIIVDHYSLDERWEKSLRPVSKKIMVIDDLADRKHDCDLLLDQNYFGQKTFQRYDNLLPDRTMKFLGPRFALIKKDFLLKKKRIRSQMSKILVFMGGSDSENQTGNTLEALRMVNLDLEIDIVLGQNYLFEGTLPDSNTAFNYNIYKNLPNLSDLMFKADLMIGAGGTTTWERLTLNLPSLVVTMAENQREINEALYKDNLHYYLGDSFSVTVEDYVDAIKYFLDGDHLREMSQKISNFMDGSQFASVLDFILQEGAS